MKSEWKECTIMDIDIDVIDGDRGKTILIKMNCLIMAS